MGESGWWVDGDLAVPAHLDLAITAVLAIAYIVFCIWPVLAAAALGWFYGPVASLAASIGWWLVAVFVGYGALVGAWLVWGPRTRR